MSFIEFADADIERIEDSFGVRIYCSGGASSSPASSPISSEESSPESSDLSSEESSPESSDLSSEVSSPDVSSPDVSSPDVSSPDVSSPDVSSEDVSSPETSAPLSDLTSELPETTALSPDVSSPDVSSPDVSSPDVSSPDVSSPDVSSPDVSSPDVSSPDVSSPDVSSEDVSSPDVSSPDVSSPDVSSPDVSSPDVSSPDVSSPDVSSPEASSDYYDPWLCCLGYLSAVNALYYGTGQSVAWDEDGESGGDGNMCWCNINGALPATVVPFNCWTTYCTGGASCVFVPRLADRRAYWKNPPTVPDWISKWVSEADGTGEWQETGTGWPTPSTGWHDTLLRYYWGTRIGNAADFTFGNNSYPAYECVYDEEASNCTPNEKPCCENTYRDWTTYESSEDCWNEAEWIIYVACAAYTQCTIPGNNCEYELSDCTEVEIEMQTFWVADYSLMWDGCVEEEW